MCLPVIVLLFMCIMWLGKSLVAQSEVTVEARNDAWRKRYESKEAKPFDFGRDGQVSGSATKEVHVSPVFDGFGQPQASHIVLGGAWDHRQVDDLNTHVNFQRWEQLAERAGVQVGDQALGAISDLGELTAGLGNKINGFTHNMFGSKLDRIDGLLDERKEKEKQVEEEKKKKFEEDKRKHQTQIGTLTAEIGQLDRDIVAKKRESEQIEKHLKRAENPQTEDDKLSDEEKKDFEEEKKRIDETIIPGLRQQKEEKIKQREVHTTLLNQLGGSS